MYVGNKHRAYEHEKYAPRHALPFKAPRPATSIAVPRDGDRYPDDRGFDSDRSQDGQGSQEASGSRAQSYDLGGQGRAEDGHQQGRGAGSQNSGPPPVSAEVSSHGRPGSWGAGGKEGFYGRNDGVDKPDRQFPPLEPLHAPALIDDVGPTRSGYQRQVDRGTYESIQEARFRLARGAEEPDLRDVNANEAQRQRERREQRAAREAEKEKNKRESKERQEKIKQKDQAALAASAKTSVSPAPSFYSGLPHIKRKVIPRVLSPDKTAGRQKSSPYEKMSLSQASSSTKKTSSATAESPPKRPKVKPQRVPPQLKPTVSQPDLDLTVGSPVKEPYSIDAALKRKKEKQNRRKEAKAKGLPRPVFSDDDEFITTDEDEDDKGDERATHNVESETSDIEFSTGEFEREGTFAELMKAEETRIREGGSPDLLLALEEEGPDPTTLCPFCSHILPAEPSERLVNLQTYLLERPNIQPNPTVRNPLGMRLPMIETASFCRRHDEETVVIPAGIERGWPQRIEWDGLPRRIRKELAKHLNEVIMGVIPSSFLDDARAEWERNGRKMNNIMSEWGSFDIEQPGYYGTRGFELFTAIVRKMFVEEMDLLATFRTAPLDPSAYIRRVLVPEIAVELIRRDLGCSREEAMEIRRESAAFGKAMFGSTKEDDEFARAEEAREQREVERVASQKEAVRKLKQQQEKVNAAAADAEALAELNRVDVVPMDVDSDAPAMRVPKRRLEMQARAVKLKKPSSSSKDVWSANIRDQESNSSLDVLSSEHENDRPAIAVQQSKGNSKSSNKPLEGRVKIKGKNKEKVSKSQWKSKAEERREKVRLGQQNMRNLAQAQLDKLDSCSEENSHDSD